MSINDSKQYESRILLPHDTQTATEIEKGLAEFLRIAPYAPGFTPSTEIAQTLEPAVYHGNALSLRSRFEHGTIDAVLDAQFLDEGSHLRAKTEPDLPGYWRTTDGELHHVSTLLSHMSQHLPDSPLMQHLLDTPEPTPEEIHDLFERIVRDLGARASIATAYELDDEILSAVFSEQGEIIAGSEYTDGSTTTIGSATEIRDGQPSEQYQHVKVATKYMIGESAVHYSQFAVRGPEATKLGVRMSGNYYKIPDLAEQVRYADVRDNLLSKLDQANLRLNVVDPQDSAA